MTNFKTLMASAAVLATSMLITPAFAAAPGNSETGVELGMPGIDAYESGNLNYANTIFKWEEQRMPGNPMVQYNLATTANAAGDRAAAASYYHQVTESGRGVHTTIIDPHQQGDSLAEAACKHLRDMGDTCSI